MADELWIVVELGLVRYDDLQAPKTRRQAPSIHP
jgi:hypothetical protein